MPTVSSVSYEVLRQGVVVASEPNFADALSVARRFIAADLFPPPLTIRRRLLHKVEPRRFTPRWTRRRLA